MVVWLLAGISVVEAAPPRQTPTGELEPQGVCVTYMDFTHAVQGSAADGLADAIMTMTYDSKGQVVAERWWRIDTPVRIIAHSYGELDQKTKTTWRLTDHKLVLTIAYRHDKSGRLVEETSIYPDGQRWKSKWKFDKRGRLILARAPGESGSARSRKFRYQNDRIATEEVDRSGNGKIDEIVSYRYDDHGRLKSKRMKPTSRDYADQLVEYEYDKAGQLIESKNTHLWRDHPDWNGPREVKSYQYDDLGNLVVVEQRVTPTTAVGVRRTYDYSCHDDGTPARSVPAAKCRDSYPDCGSPL